MSNVFNEYPVNGVGPYYITFEYQKQEDVVVLFRRISDERYVVQFNTDWSFENATTIKLNVTPSADYDRVRVQRQTDVNPLNATFYPGSAIRAQDLNANFEQLMMAIEEGQQSLTDTSDYVDQFFWNKLEDTIKESDQKDGTVNTKLDDDHLFTAGASAARHDAYVSDNKPANLTYEQPGKIWNDTDDLQDYFWDPTANAWVSFTKSGPSGAKGDYGPPGKVIISDNPPMMYPAVGDNQSRPLESGDMWWDSNRVLLYVYYTDNNSSQWVAVSKTGPQGEPGEKGESGESADYTFINPLTLTGDTVTFEIDNLSTI